MQQTKYVASHQPLPITVFLLVQLCSSVSLCTGHLLQYFCIAFPWICSVKQMQASSTGWGILIVSGTSSNRIKLVCPSLVTINPGTMFLLVQSCSIVSLCSLHLWLYLCVNLPWMCIEEQVQAISSLFAVSDCSSACEPISISRCAWLGEIWQHVKEVCSQEEH